MFDNTERILVVAAHPDDEVLGCGGTIVRARDCGIEVGVMFLGEGVSARFDLGDYDNFEFKSQSAVRQLSMENSLDILGVQLIRADSFHCTQFDTLPLLQLVKIIESVINEYRPTTILTHSPSETNIDHRIVYNAVEVACRPISWKHELNIYSFEVVCSGSFKFVNDFFPNYFVNITDYWENKMEAWASYSGEARPFPFPRSDKGLEILANYRGMQSGVQMAEAFRLNRCVI